MKWVGFVLGVLLLVFLVQNWQPLLPVVVFGQPIFAIPLGLGFVLAFCLGILCAWGLNWWVETSQHPKPEEEVIVLEPEDVEYPRRRPPPSEDEWDFADDWD